MQGESASVPYYVGCTGEQGEACCTNVLWEEEEPCFSLSAVFLWGFKKGAFCPVNLAVGSHGDDTAAAAGEKRPAVLGGCFSVGGNREKRSELCWLQYNLVSVYLPFLS